MSASPELSVDAVRALYEKQAERHAWARKLLGRPITYAEKILFAHMKPSEVSSAADVTRRKSSIRLYPDRAALQDATAQMAILQFMQSGMPRVKTPTTIHCDHLIRAQTGAKDDLLRAVDENSEVYDFLASSGKKYGMGFWKPGAGIIHQVVLENYAFPGGHMIGTDSHTPNAGGLGMVAVGVRGADAVELIVRSPLGLRLPGLLGVRLTGSLKGWTAPKDVILALLGILTVKGGTGHIVEFFGPGTANLSCTGKGTICNMGAEHGATTSTFPFDASMATYLRATDRGAIAELAEKHAEELRSDPEVDGDADKFYDRVIEIDLDTLEPHVNGPHSPDRAWPISKLAQAVKDNGWPDDLRYGLIGSCTNSSYEDMERAAEVIRQAQEVGIAKLAKPLMVTPGSDQIHNTIRRDGQLEVFEGAGATLLANACGPCIGQWKRVDIAPKESNSIINSFNRNFKGRNDGNRETLSFIASPETVVALSLAGRLSFNHLTDTLEGKNGAVTIPPPDPAPNGGLPTKGFAEGLEGFDAPAPESEAGSVEVIVSPTSKRIQLLTPFDTWSGEDLADMPVLLRAFGKCTTDHISPAGPWLRFRGHLDNISDNMYIGAANVFTDEPGTGVNVFTGEKGVNLSKLARDYKARGVSWAVFGDENYGEGSSREHAAMEPRHLGCRLVVARSFARIAETNLKKQGVIAATFADPADFDKILVDDRIGVTGLANFAPGKPLTVVVTHKDGSIDRFDVNHSFDEEQIGWFRAGSALNALKASQAAN